MLQISIGGTGAGANADAQSTGVVEAFIGAANGRTRGGLPTALLDINGVIDVDAASDIDAVARADGAGAAAGVSVTAMLPSATAGGATRAYAGDGTDIRATDLQLNADSVIVADAKTKAVAVSGLGAGVGANANATVSSSTEAYVGEHADSTRTTLAVIDINNTSGTPGTVTVGATSSAQALAKADGGSGSAISISVMLPTANLSGFTRAYIGPWTQLNAASATLTATDTVATADAETFVVNIGLLVGVAGTSATANVTRTVEAFVGHHADVNLGTGALSATATSPVTKADADSRGAGAGTVNVTALKSLGDVDGLTSAYVDANASVDAGSLTLSATSTTTALAATNFIGFSAIAGVTGSKTIANAGHDTVVRIGDDAVVNVGNGAITMTATGTSTATPTIDNTGISLAVDVQLLDAISLVDATTAAIIGDGADIDAGRLTMTATGTHNVGANVSSFGASLLVAIGDIKADAKDQGNVEVRIGPAAGLPGDAGDPTTVDTTQARASRRLPR